MLKTLSKISVVLYLVVYYGQDFFDKGSMPRKYFYFIGMSVVMSLISYTLYRSDKNIATSFLLFVFIGELFNNIFYAGQYSNMEIGFGVLGVIYILFENKIKKLWILKK